MDVLMVSGSVVCICYFVAFVFEMEEPFVVTGIVLAFLCWYLPRFVLYTIPKAILYKFPKNLYIALVTKIKNPKIDWTT